MPRELTLADGQLPTTAATLVSGGDVPNHHVSGVFANVSTYDVTVTITFKRAGGTARRIAYAVLAPNESLRLNDQPIQGDDTLLGLASVATAIDYVLFVGSPGGQAPGVAQAGAAGSIRSEMSGSLTLATESALAISEAPSVEESLAEQTHILRRVLLALELMTGQQIPDAA